MVRVEELASLTLPDLIVHPDPIIRWLIQQAINRFDELGEEKKVLIEMKPEVIPCYS